MSLIHMSDSPSCRYPGCTDPEIKNTIINGCVLTPTSGYVLASSGRIHLHDAYLTDARVGRRRTRWERLTGKNRLQKAPDYVKRDGVIIKGESPTWFLTGEGVDDE